jgi:hypothetical protein
MGVNVDLKKMIQAVKSKPCNFAIVSRGKTVALMLSKKTISPPALADLKKRTGTKNVYQGVCETGGKGLSFKSLDAIPPNLSMPLKTYIKDETGVTLDPEFEQVATLKTVANDDEDDATEAKTEDGPVEAAGNIPTDPRWVKERAAIEPMFKEAVSRNPENRTKLLGAWAMGCEKAENGDFDTALKVMAKLRPALEAVIAAEPDFIDVQMRDASKINPKSDLKNVEGAKSSIDFEARKAEDIVKKKAYIMDFLAKYDAKVAETEAQIAENDQDLAVVQRTRTTYVTLKARWEAEKTLAEKLHKEAVDRGENPGALPSYGEGLEFDTILKQCDAYIKNFEETLAKFQVNRAKLDEKKAEFEDCLINEKSAKTEQEKFDALNPGSEERIAAVQSAMIAVSEKLTGKLMILGRLADTIGDEETKKAGKVAWLDKNKEEAGRVLGADAWAMSVNDAFVNSGIDQKAQVALLTKFKKEVQEKVRKLLKDPGTLSKEDIKKEIRAFAKASNDDALYKGEWEKNNDGFSIYMSEVEQLIDDGYVMMEHDPAGKVNAGEGDGLTQVMVPSGKGQKIKDELAEEVLAKERKQTITDGLRALITDPEKKRLITGPGKGKDEFDALKLAIASRDMDLAEAKYENLCRILN